MAGKQINYTITIGHEPGTDNYRIIGTIDCQGRANAEQIATLIETSVLAIAAPVSRKEYRVGPQDS